MKKIPTLFRRDPDNMSRVIPEVHPDCQWVIDGEGWPTRKLDGMCCAIIKTDGMLFVKRREVGKGKTTPAHFIPAMTDEVTGKTVGWVPVFHGPEDRYFAEAFNRPDFVPEIGTYELVGPKSQGGIEGYPEHKLIKHDSDDLHIREVVPRTLEGLRDWLADKPIEGIVWHHSDGRMAKIKGKDFGHKRVKP